VKERRFSAASKEPREERGFSPRDLHGKLCRNRPWQAGGRAVAPMASALPEERNGRQTHSFRNSILLAVRISVLEKLPYCAAICRLVRECMPDTTFVNRVFAVSQRTSEGTTPSPPWSFSTAFHKRIAIPVTNNLYWEIQEAQANHMHASYPYQFDPLTGDRPEHKSLPCNILAVKPCGSGFYRHVSRSGVRKSLEVSILQNRS